MADANVVTRAKPGHAQLPVYRAGLAAGSIRSGPLCNGHAANGAERLVLLALMRVSAEAVLQTAADLRIVGEIGKYQPVAGPKAEVPRLSKGTELNGGYKQTAMAMGMAACWLHFWPTAAFYSKGI